MTGLLSLLLVPLSWAIFLSVAIPTPDLAVAHSVAVAQPSAMLNLNEGFEIAAIVDFVVWFGLVRGVENLWTQFSEERAASGITRHWPNPVRRSGIWRDALLCAVPLSYYAVLAAAISLKLDMLRWSGVVFRSVAYAKLCCLFRRDLWTVRRRSQILAKVRRRARITL
jgi:hypothetical protein